MKTILKILIFFISFFTANLFAQNIDIIPVLQKIESGNIEEAGEQFRYLKMKFPHNPQILFLEGLLNKDGKKAVEIFSEFYKNYPENKYADAALFRVYAYYFALGSYETAGKYLASLKEKYPSSQYIKLADKNFPAEFEEAAAKTPERKTADSKADNYVYTIQAGAFSNISNANKLKDEFEKHGYHTEIFNKTVGGTNFHVVLVGQFKTDDEAQSFLRIINTKFKLNGIIVAKN